MDKIITKIPKLTIMCGLPASGKSTWIEDHKKENEVIVSLDEIRREIFGHQFHGPAEPFVIAIGETMTRMLLSQEVDVILDSTAPTRVLRKKWASLAISCGADWRIVYMDTSPEECEDRDARRGEGKSVGEKVMERFIDTFEEPEEDEVMDKKNFIRYSVR